MTSQKIIRMIIKKEVLLKKIQGIIFLKKYWDENY